MKKRKTIGIMINCLNGSYLTYFWLMIKKAAEKLDCNLIVYEGRAINYYTQSDKKHTIIYGFIDKKRVDGLIMTSALTDNLNDRECMQFLERFKGIPLISIGKVIPGFTSILVDNKKGMKSLIKHLVEDHGYKKILFVTGPKNNFEAIERYQAYLEVLEENGIDVDENIIFEGDFNSQTGCEIMEKIIHKGIEYDAAVFSNDDMALGALKAVNDLSKVYNFDISKKNVICGFDDTLNSKLTEPSLTTVSQPLEELCLGALKTLLEKIDGKTTENILTYPAVLVKRQSCGCKGQSALDEISNKYLRLVPEAIFHTQSQTYILNDLYDKITRTLKKSGWRTCLIATYFEGTITYNDSLLLKKSFNVPEKSELLYVYYNNERIEIKDSDRYFNTKDIVPERYLPKDRRFIYLVNPLYFDKDNFGFICLEIVNDDLVEYESFRGFVSNMLKGALLMQEKEKMENVLLESERLSSLGQLVGGISHNLMSPIMSISGVQVAMESLINEYEESLLDSEVTKEDYIEILDEMEMWSNRLREFNSYMSKVIGTIKSQAVELNSDITNEFTIEELLDRIKFILSNNTRLDKCILNIEIDISIKTKISGDITSLIKIIDNLLVNGVESYKEKDENAYRIDMKIYSDGNSVIFKLRDYGSGISDDIKDKIFKHMLTSKGKNGTGLSLFLSYSTIKGRFGGEMWFEEVEGRGVELYISIPVKKIK
ncbi:UNVERIFIED_CONTAM: DNA-binding LacI/PurR family transcriptional regulator [Acetivibrio alkalicellulosi]